MNDLRGGFSGIPLFLKSALFGMAVATLLMGLMVPPLRMSLVVSLMVASILIVVGYYTVRRVLGLRRLP